jgi:hypothetical protein
MKFNRMSNCSTALGPVASPQGCAQEIQSAGCFQQRQKGVVAKNLENTIWYMFFKALNKELYMHI